MARGFQLKIDTGKLRRTTKRVASRFKSVSLQFKSMNKGAGVVLVSRRKKKPWEKKRALHGKAIANIFESRGRKPFYYPLAAKKAALSILDKKGVRSAIKAFDKGRYNKALSREMYEAAAKYLAKYARQRIVKGELYPQTKRLTSEKRYLYRVGKAKYKYVHTYGARTGRFVEGIKGQYKGSRKGLANVGGL